MVHSRDDDRQLHHDAEDRDAALSPVSFLTQGETATLLRPSGSTLAQHRVTGTGPAFVRLGCRIVYRPRDLVAWADAHTYRSTSEAAL